MTETERQALDALVAWRKADVELTFALSRPHPHREKARVAFKQAEHTLRFGTERLIAEREGR